MPILKESESTFTPVPAGAHAARCYAMISIGTQAGQNPLYRPQFQVILNFEIPGELIEYQGEKRPMVISQFLNAYLGRMDKPSNTRKFLEQWRGKPFTEQEMKGFDLSKLVGAKCLLNIIHEVKNGKTREKIASVSPLPKGMTIGEQYHKSVIYEIEQGRDEVFNALPEWVRKKIEACEEWNEPQRATSEEEVANKAADEAVTEKKESDDVPF